MRPLGRTRPPTESLLVTATDRSIELINAAAQAAADKLAHDIIAYDVSDVLSITDAFLLASAPNDRQVKSIVDEIEERLSKELGAKPVRREGDREARWVLLDYVDIVVHVQHSEERVFYALERLWKDCPELDLPADAKATRGKAAEHAKLQAEEDAADGGAAVTAAADTGHAEAARGRRIVLWRHGQTSWNLERRFQGTTDIELTETGVAQARRAARLLASLKPDAIVASDLQRAAATAAELAALTGLDGHPRRGPARDLRGRLAGPDARGDHRAVTASSTPRGSAASRSAAAAASWRPRSPTGPPPWCCGTPTSSPTTAPSSWSATAAPSAPPSAGCSAWSPTTGRASAASPTAAGPSSARAPAAGGCWSTTPARCRSRCSATTTDRPGPGSARTGFHFPAGRRLKFFLFAAAAAREERRGAIAQLVERLHGMQEVRSSILLSSTEIDSRKSRSPQGAGLFVPRPRPGRRFGTAIAPVWAASPRAPDCSLRVECAPSWSLVGLT